MDNENALTARSARKAGFSQEAAAELRNEMHKIADEYADDYLKIFNDVREKALAIEKYEKEEDGWEDEDNEG